MQRPLFASIVVSLLAAAVLFSGIGCGGGGGGGKHGGSSGGSTGTVTRPNGTIFSQQLVGVTSGTFAARNLANLRTGDVVQLRSLALYVSSNGYEGGFLENVTSVVLNAPASVAVLNGTSLRAVGPGTGTITAVGANGVPLSATISVTTGLTAVSGRVRTVQVGTANAGVATAIVRFFDVSGNEVASVPTGPDGRYVANVPASARSFVVDFASMPNSFYNQFTYGTFDYTATVSGCAVPLPAFTAGGALTLSDAIGYKKVVGSGSTPPPPPPSGCGG